MLTTPPISKQQSYLGQFALALGGFAMGISDLVTGGLLPEMAKSTEVVIPVAGHYIANYALGVLIGAPLLAFVTAKLNKKSLLLGLLLFYGFVNFLCLFFNYYAGIALLRFLAGLPHGIYFGVACVVAAAMVEEKRQPRAVANVVLGVTFAGLLGVPFAVYLGQMWGWQVAYGLVAILAIFACLLIFYAIPKQLNIAKTTPLKEIKILKRPSVLLLLAFVAIESAGLPTINSYLKVILLEDTGYQLESIPFLMSIVGIGMLCANLIGPKLTQHFGAYRTLLMVTLASLTVYIAFYFLCHNKVGVILACFFLGTSFAAFPAIQTRMLAIAKDGPTLASALIQSAFYTANAIGARSGGALIAANYPYANIALLAAGFSIAGFVIFIFLYLLETKKAAEASADS